MYAVTSTLFERRTLATLRKAEFGFFGVTVRTNRQTPLFCGAPLGSSRTRLVCELRIARKAGVLGFLRVRLRGFLINWFSVGTGSVLL